VEAKNSLWRLETIACLAKKSSTWRRFPASLIMLEAKSYAGHEHINASLQKWPTHLHYWHTHKGKHWKPNVSFKPLPIITGWSSSSFQHLLTPSWAAVAGSRFSPSFIFLSTSPSLFKSLLYQAPFPFSHSWSIS